MKYEISVLIPVYNVEKYIVKCLNSLFSNTIAELCEFIIVNDCSTDSSLSQIKLCISKFPKINNQIKIINHEKNLGLAGARNTGLQNAVGDFIICVDGDDWVEESYLESLLSEAKKTGADIVGCDWYEESENKTSVYRQNLPQEKTSCIKNLFENKLKGFLWVKLIRRQLFVDNNISWIEGLNMWEDILIMSQIFSVAEIISYIQVPLYHYIRTNSSSLSYSFSKEKFNQMFNVLNEIKKFLIDKNTLSLYENSYYFLVGWTKLFYLKTIKMTKAELERIVIACEVNSLMENIEAFGIKDKLIITLLYKKMYFILDMILRINRFKNRSKRNKKK